MVYSNRAFINAAPQVKQSQISVSVTFLLITPSFKFGLAEIELFVVLSIKLFIKNIGDNCLSVRAVGHTSEHLPHTAQAKKSIICFGLNVFMLFAPKVSRVSKFFGVSITQVLFKLVKKNDKGLANKCMCLDSGM